MEQLTVLTVHAHPDDEASKGAATIARYAAQGVRTVLVTCTGGEEGDILNPALDCEEVKSNLAGIRRSELDVAAGIIGYEEVVMLGYRDSGMAGSETNNHPDCFAAAKLDEAVGRLVAVIRRTRPQVVVTYPKDQQGYPHPDHLRVNEISEIAFDAAADPVAFPEAGEAWQVSRLCYVRWSLKRMKAMHSKFEELGLDSPFLEGRFAEVITKEEPPPPPEALPIVTIDVSGHGHVTRMALLAHATQVDPTSRFWFGLPPEVADEVHPFEEYEIARDISGSEEEAVAAGDLFAGLVAMSR